MSNQPESSPLGAVVTSLKKGASMLYWLLAAALLIQCGGKAAKQSTTPAEVDLGATSPTSVAKAEEPDAHPSGSGPVQATSPLIPVDAGDIVSGDHDALVTLVQFEDFQCPFCARVQPTIARLRDKYSNQQLRIVFKHNPLPFHQEALPAARAAQAVHEVAGTEAFFPYAKRLFENQRNLTEANLELWAEELGIDGQTFWSAWEANTTIEKVQRDMALAQKIGARGTPNFRVNGVEVSGAQPYDKFEEVVDLELRAAQALVDTRVPRNEVYALRVATNFSLPRPSTPVAEPDEDTTIWKVPIGRSPTHGPGDAPVTIVEFGDYQCPFCLRAQATLKQLEQQYPGKLRFVFKHNALPFHPRAKPAAMLAIEAHQQKGNAGFWDVHERLWQSQNALEDSDLLSIAKDAGLNQYRVRQAIANNTHQTLLDADMDLASNLKARGTPTFFINGRRVSGAQPVEKFAEVIDAQLTVAEALIAKGTGPGRVYDEIMKTAQGPPPPETRKVALPSRTAPSRGPAGAPVVIQMFSDYQCPFCNRVLPTLQQLQKEFPWQVRVVWRDLPLEFHQHAALAAEAAREAYAQRGNNGYWKMHDLLFAHQRDAGGLERAALEQYAAQLGLDMQRFQTALDQHTHAPAVAADAAVAKQANIRGTPAFLINDYFLSGAQPIGSFRQLVKRAIDDRKRGTKP